MAEFVVYIGLPPSEYENTSYRKLKQEKMSADNPKNVLIRLLADAKQFSSELLGAESSLQQFSSKATSVGKSAIGLGSKMSLGVTLPLAYAGKKLYDPGKNAREEELRKYLRQLWKDKYNY